MAYSNKKSFLLILILSVGLLGCGSTGPQRHIIAGTVTLNDKPLTEGSITFVPQSGGATGTSAEIADGKFAVEDQLRGLSIGDYRVEITSTQKTGKMIPGAGPNGEVEEVKQVIPPRYNVNTQLTASVTEDGDNTFSFELTN